MMCAAKLDVGLYEEGEADKEALSQAITVVIFSSVASGIGAIGTIGLKVLGDGSSIITARKI